MEYRNRQTSKRFSNLKYQLDGENISENSKDRRTQDTDEGPTGGAVPVQRYSHGMDMAGAKSMAGMGMAAIWTGEGQ